MAIDDGKDPRLTAESGQQAIRRQLDFDNGLWTSKATGKPKGRGRYEDGPMVRIRGPRIVRRPSAYQQALEKMSQRSTVRDTR